MSSLAEIDVCTAYGIACFFVTAAFQLGLCNPVYLALDFESVFYKHQVWRLVTNFFFLGPFSINFVIHFTTILFIVSKLEEGPFDRRPADFLWMMIVGASSLLMFSVIPLFHSYFMGVSLVSMLRYVWSRELPNNEINFCMLVTLRMFSVIPLFHSYFMRVSLASMLMLLYVLSRDFPNSKIRGRYLPWVMLGLDVMFGSPPMPILAGIIVGRLYYILSVVYPRAGGKDILRTPNWVHKAVDSIEEAADSIEEAISNLRRN